LLSVEQLLDGLARISHRPGYHSDFGEDVERKSHQAGWAV
jgi:hypothetical protein